MAELGGGVASVVEQKDQKILVSVPLAGIPPGFRLRPGEKVVLVNEASGLVARPLIVTRRVKMTARDLEQADNAVDIEGERYAVQSASQLGWASAEGKQVKPGEYEVFIVESSAQGPKQIIASRPVNPGTAKR
jgi:hypothetical protein